MYLHSVTSIKHLAYHRSTGPRGQTNGEAELSGTSQSASGHPSAQPVKRVARRLKILTQLYDLEMNIDLKAYALKPSVGKHLFADGRPVCTNFSIHLAANCSGNITKYGQRAWNRCLMLLLLDHAPPDQKQLLSNGNKLI